MSLFVVFPIATCCLAPKCHLMHAEGLFVWVGYGSNIICRNQQTYCTARGNKIKHVLKESNFLTNKHFAHKQTFLLPYYCLLFAWAISRGGARRGDTLPWNTPIFPALVIFGSKLLSPPFFFYITYKGCASIHHFHINGKKLSIGHCKSITNMNLLSI